MPRLTNKQVAYILRHFGRMSTLEIARQLGVTPKTVKYHAVRAGLCELTSWCRNGKGCGSVTKRPRNQFQRVVDPTPEQIYMRAAAIRAERERRRRESAPAERVDGSPRRGRVTLEKCYD